MTGSKRSSVPRQTSYNSLYLNPLTEIKHNRSSSEGGDHSNASAGATLGLRLCRNSSVIISDNKENVTPNIKGLLHLNNKENVVPSSNSSAKKEEVEIPDGNSPPSMGAKKRLLKSSSLQLCMQLNEPDSAFGSKLWNPFESNNSSRMNVWDHSDSEAAPASSWSTLPNRSLLCRPLPLDVGRCTCVIVKEALDGGTVYSLYTNEGHGRQDRKLAVAHHRRCNGRSEFLIAQNMKGISCSSDESFLGNVTANLMGSKYQIWGQGSRLDSSKKQPKLLLAIVSFMPTISTWTGRYRSMRAWIPKHQSMQLKSTTQGATHARESELPSESHTNYVKSIIKESSSWPKVVGSSYGSHWNAMLVGLHMYNGVSLMVPDVATTGDISIQHINGLPKDWEGKMNKVHQLFSTVPHFNNISRRYELDFRERGRAGLRIQSSVKNFQLTMEENGRQSILQLGRVDKSKYVMDYRYPLTGYQAFCICLASMDSKLCCTV